MKRFNNVPIGCLAALGLLLANGIQAGAEPGEVFDFQKISSTRGDFEGTLENGDVFGVSASFIGDLNGDTFEDVVVGATGDSDGVMDAGAVWILFLNDAGKVKVHQKISPSDGGFTGLLDPLDNFGFTTVKIPDLDSDGVDEIAVGAIGDDDGGTDRGAVWILFMNTDGTVKAHQKISSTDGSFSGVLDNSDQFGSALASIGDLDGDGNSDLMVGARFDDDGAANAGAVWILYLNNDGTVKSHSKINSGVMGIAAEANAYFGSAIALDDIDGDATIDIVVGAFGADDGGPDRGAVWVLFMNMDGSLRDLSLVSSTSGRLDGTVLDGDGFGRSLAVAGDVLGNGTRTIVVGSHRSDEGGLDKGFVRLLFLDDAGLVDRSIGIAEGMGGFDESLYNEGQFGISVSAIPIDLNEGEARLLVGALFDDDGGMNRGAVWTMSLESLRLMVPSGSDIWPVGSLRTVSWQGQGPVDIFLSVDGGRTFDTLQSTIRGNEHVLRVPHSPTRYAVLRVERSLPYAASDSDSFFVITSDIDLLAFDASPVREGDGVRLSWRTWPSVEDLAGYRLDKRDVADGAWVPLVELTQETAFLDPDPAPGLYRITAVNGLGNERILGETSGEALSALEVGPIPLKGSDLDIRYRNAYPDTRATLGVYDVAGREVANIHHGSLSAGDHAWSWDRRDRNGERVATGLYYVALRIGEQVLTEKVAVLQ